MRTLEMKNLSNFLTLIRVIIIPIIVLCIYLKNPFFGWTAFFLFCLASITDYFDGYLARTRNEITNIKAKSPVILFKSLYIVCFSC